MARGLPRKKAASIKLGRNSGMDAKPAHEDPSKSPGLEISVTTYIEKKSAHTKEGKKSGVLRKRRWEGQAGLKR